MLQLPHAPELPNSRGFTALDMAVEGGFVEVARLLLEAGFDKDLANEEGTTALMMVSRMGHVELVRLLLEVGAKTDLKDYCGATALMFASSCGHHEVVRLLLEDGVDTDLADHARLHSSDAGNCSWPRSNGAPAPAERCRYGHCRPPRLYCFADRI